MSTNVRCTFQSTQCCEDTRRHERRYFHTFMNNFYFEILHVLVQYLALGDVLRPHMQTYCRAMSQKLVSLVCLVGCKFVFLYTVHKGPWDEPYLVPRSLKDFRHRHNDNIREHTQRLGRIFEVNPTGVNESRYPVRIKRIIRRHYELIPK